MARERINTRSNDLISDSGAVLWSIIKGEQLEFPIVVDFLVDTTVAGYVFEAVIVEGANVAAQEDPPVTRKTGGVETTLTVRVPTFEGNWSAVEAYDMEDVVLYGGIYYKLLNGAAYVNTATPDEDEQWEVTTLNTIYVQFPSSVASTWEIAPIVDSPVYGFFELRITEPFNPIYQRTWKPVRGMVEVLFSPTDIVPDV